jgi:tripartite ATP-independent transporter DctP family solute receptor
MIVTRRRLTTAIAAGGVASGLLGRRGRAQGARFTLKCGSDVPDSHSVVVRLKEASARILAETDGQVDVQIFPNNQLGSDTDMLSQLRSGGLELLSMPGTVLATLVPAASLNSIGFAFKDYKTVWRAMDGETGQYIREQIGKFGIVVLDKIWDNGFRQVTTRSKPITSPEDLHDVKLRVPVSPLLISLFKALGCSPTPINFNELYSALQTRIVDGQENALPLLQSNKLFEVQKYCALTKHVWDGYWMLANRRAWGAMPAALSQVVAEQLNRSAVEQRADSEALASSLRTNLTSEGLVFNEPDTAPFREQLRKAGFYTDWRSKLGDAAWDKLEVSVGSLT